jgi:autotransporter translocation and assembly factor TamB
VDRPFVAEVELKGGGPLTHLVVEGVANLAFEGLDPVEGVAFQVTWPKATLSARWQGVRLTGRLVPLDLKAEGPLKVGAPGYYLPRAEGKAALYLRQGADGRYHLGGDLAVEQALLSLPEKPLPVREGGARPPLVFDALRIHAERGVLVRAPLVEGELGGALFLGGSAEDPYLSGEARALSGSFVLFNRRFELIEGRARFSPEHGLLPEVFLRARSENPEGTIYLVAEGRVVRQDGKLAFELDPCLSLAPVADLLSCKAEPQEPAAARLLGLEGSSAEGVAGAAVENLLVNQLENALSRALGLDVVRVETHVLTGQGLESTRFTLGKFITPEVYLAYDWSEATGSKLYARVRRDGVTLEFRTDFAPDPSPEFSLRYAFAPELSGLLELARDRFRLGFEWRP